MPSTEVSHPMKLLASTLILTLTLFTSLAWGPLASADDTTKMQTVVCTKRDLKKGTVPTESDVEEKQVEARLAPVNACGGRAAVIGRVLKRNKPKGSTILIDDIANPGDPLDD